MRIGLNFGNFIENLQKILLTYSPAVLAGNIRILLSTAGMIHPSYVIMSPPMGEHNHALGNGWSHNYSYSLETGLLYAKVTLPGGHDVYFDLIYDGSLSSQGWLCLHFGSGFHRLPSV